MFFNKKKEKEKVDPLLLSMNIQAQIGDPSTYKADIDKVSVASKSIDAMDYSNPDTKDLEKLVNKLQVENFDLRNEVGYYERYIKYLKDNYIFILKSLDCAKGLYDMIGEQNEKLD